MIKQLNQEQIKLLFPKLYKECFNTTDAPINVPPIMLVAYEDNDGGDTPVLYGFSSGFAFNDAIIYINATGIIPKYRNRKQAAKLQKTVEAMYKRMGFVSIMGHVENTNKKLLTTALLSGYKITGTMIARDNKTLLIIAKELL